MTADGNTGDNFNRYWYGNNNPYKFVDPDGRYVESAVDVALIVADAADIAKNGLNWTNGLSMAANVVGLAVPVGTGFGPAVRGGAAGVDAARGTDKVSDAARATTLKPGPYAGESIPARSAARDFNAGERAAGNRIMKDTGCHTCGTKDAGTKSGNAILDHQPPSKLNTSNAPQRLHPHCATCSRRQGGEVNAERARRAREK